MLSLICDAKSVGWRWVNRTIESCRHRMDSCAPATCVCVVRVVTEQWMNLAKLQTNKNYFSAV